MTRMFLTAFLGLAVVMAGCDKIQSLFKSLCATQVKNPQMAAFAGLGEVVQSGMAVQVTLGADALFGKKGVRLTRAGMEKVEALAKAVLKFPGDRIVVKGYTDKGGAEAKNQKLSGLQADAVKKELERGGVGASNITAQAEGSAEPAAANDNDADREKNRRIVLVINAP